MNESYPFGDQALESLSVDRGREREAQVQYYAAVSHVDENVGRLLEAVDGAGKLNNTLVVYTSDHGLNCGHHGIWGKGNGTRTRRYKLVRRHPSGPHELFDLESDPRESRSLFDSSSHRAVSSELLALIERHFRRYARPDRNGTLGAALPQHNMTEAWRV